MQNAADLTIELQKTFDAHHEWLLIRAAGKSFPLKKSEIELEFARNKLLFSFLDDQGFQTWRVTGFKTKGEEILLDLTRNFEKEREKIRLVPRTPARELSAAVEHARLAKANRLAALIKETGPRIKIIRVELNKENGRFAQIIFEAAGKQQTAVLADVSETLTPEILLSSAIWRVVRLQDRRKNPIAAIWLAGEKKQAAALQKLHALLKESWKAKIFIKEISRQIAKSPSETLKALPPLQIADLWCGRTREIKLADNPQSSETARKLIDLAPAEIDVIFSRRGETLRFNGLPFVRIRKIFNEEKVWFGVERARQLLTPRNFDECAALIENLREFRRPDSPNKRHVFYQAAPEAWLEAALRKNIKLLDANLILSPLYHQFRADRGRIDLLALRKDGRLVIIELKTAADREMIFQTADYWRKIERARRTGTLQKARLFGDLEIADRPAICYLVAPTLSFHRDFRFLASTISGELEIHRFNLGENWRADLKVLARGKV